MASLDVLILGSDMIVELCNLKDAVTDALVTGATVNGQVLDSAGAPVASVPNPFSLTEVALPSKGIYRGEIPNDAGYANGDDVTIKVTAVSGSTTRIFTVEATVVEVA